MAEINLGAIRFNWKGAYAGGTAYVVDDVVSYLGSSYVCILASTGNVPTNGTYWNLMAQAGTNGTDLTSTLTTQGDILYRNASGLARLGAGTSGQVLQTGGSSANPSWATASGGSWTLVSTTTASNNAFVDLTFSGSYSIYKITFVNMIGPDNQNLNHQILIGGSVQTGSNYKYGNIFIDSNGGTGNNTSGGAGSVKMTYAPMGAATGDNTSGTVTIYNPGSTITKHTDYTFNGTQKIGSYMNKNVGGSSWGGSNAAWTGFRVLYSSGNIASGVMKLWGQA